MMLKISTETQNCDRCEISEADCQLQDLQRKWSRADSVSPESIERFERGEKGNGGHNCA